MSFAILNKTIHVPNMHLSNTLVPALAFGALGAYIMTKREFGKAEDAQLDVLDGNNYDVIGRRNGLEMRKYHVPPNVKSMITSSIAGIAAAGLGGLILTRGKSIGEVASRMGMAKSQAVGAVGMLLVGAGIGISAGSVGAQTLYANTVVARST